MSRHRRQGVPPKVDGRDRFASRTRLSLFVLVGPAMLRAFPQRTGPSTVFEPSRCCRWPLPHSPAKNPSTTSSTAPMTTRSETTHPICWPKHDRRRLRRNRQHRMQAPGRLLLPEQPKPEPRPPGPGRVLAHQHDRDPPPQRRRGRPCIDAALRRNEVMIRLPTFEPEAKNEQRMTRRRPRTIDGSNANTAPSEPEMRVADPQADCSVCPANVSFHTVISGLRFRTIAVDPPDSERSRAFGGSDATENLRLPNPHPIAPTSANLIRQSRPTHTPSIPKSTLDPSRAVGPLLKLPTMRSMRYAPRLSIGRRPCSTSLSPLHQAIRPRRQHGAQSTLDILLLLVPPRTLYAFARTARDARGGHPLLAR